MSHTVFLKQSFPFASAPRTVDVESDLICPDEAQFPASIDPTNQYNPHNVRAFVIGHEFGALCMVFSSNAQDAMDEACNKGFIDRLMSEEQDYDDESLTPLGNAGELFDLSMAWCGKVEWDAARDIGLIVAIVRAHAAGEDCL